MAKPDATLNEILEILKRIEERQVKTTAKVEHIEEAKTPVVGSFATVETEKEKEEEEEKGR